MRRRVDRRPRRHSAATVTAHRRALPCLSDPDLGGPHRHILIMTTASRHDSMLKELLLLRTEVGGIQLNWDGSEVFHLVIRNSWVERIRLCHSHNTEHEGLVARRIRFRRSLIRRRRRCRVTRRPVPASRCTPRGRTGADDDFLDRRQRIAVGSNEFQMHYRGAVAAVVKPTSC